MLSMETALKLNKRELAYIAVQALQDVNRLECYIKELWCYTHEVEAELNEIVESVTIEPDKT